MVVKYLPTIRIFCLVQVSLLKKWCGDLGIHFDTQLKFDKNVSAIVRDVNYRLSSLKRSFSKIKSWKFSLLYKSLVCLLLEHNTSVWFPWNVMDELHVEKVQRRAPRLIPYLQPLPYKERLTRFGIPSLHFRRCRGNLINVFCIIKGTEEVDFDSFFKHNHYHTTHQQRYKLYLSKSKKKTGTCSFAYPLKSSKLEMCRHLNIP